MSRAAFDVKIQYSVMCYRCDREHVIDSTWLFARTELPMPSLPVGGVRLPAGWVSLNGSVICDHHEIRVVNRVAEATT